MASKPKEDEENAATNANGLTAARKIIEGSGNNFHAKVARFFRANEWEVMISPYYVDPSTDKAREIDLIVEKVFPVKHRFYERYVGAIRFRLHIECKFIKHTAVFWFDGVDEKQAMAWIERNTLFKTTEGIAAQHHYASSRTNQVAKLFATDNSKELETDPMFKALNQCLNGLVSSRGASHLLPDAKHIPCIKTVEYPVIVCSSFDCFFRTRVVGPADVEKMEENFLIEVNYAYVNANAAVQRQYFLIDVVDFGRLTRFIASLEDEAKHMSDIAKLRGDRH